MDEKRKKEILEKLEKASSEEYSTEWGDNHLPVSKKKSEISKGKKAKKSGGSFELKVRKDLELKNWIVSKWSNNVDLELKKLIPAKRKFNPYSKVMAIGTGFPDFIAFQSLGENSYNVIGVESKLSGVLTKEEKEKCVFLIENKVFNQIWIAKKDEGPLNKIIYENFSEKYSKLFGI